VKLLDRSNVRRILFFSLEAALCWTIAEVLSELAVSSTKISFAEIVFLFLIDFCLELIFLTPGMTARAIAGGPPEGSARIIMTGVHYATYYVFFRIPFLLMTGRFGAASWAMAGSILFYAAWAGLSYAAVWRLLLMPQVIPGGSMDEMYAALTDSDKCMTSLGDFMTILAQTLGERRPMEKLWQPVYAYLKDLPKIQNLVRGKGIRHDEIVLNAVGSIAFRLLAGGGLHSAPGVLSPDGEYVRKVWWVTANELVRRSYNKPEDVTEGLRALDAAILSVGVPK
jgi:hypothetical protein